MKTYADLLRGNIFQSIEDVKEKLKDENDSIFWWESNQIWGYTTKELLKESIYNAIDNNLRESLINMCKYLRMNELNTSCDNYNRTDRKTVAEFIGLEIS
jgi:hypothetical protein